MGKVGIMIFSLVKHLCFDFALSSVTQLSSGNPFVVIQKFPFGCKTDHGL